MRLGWHWENTPNHTCMAGAWRRQCLTVMATNKLGRLATADSLEERGNGASDIHKGHSKGIRKWSQILLEGVTKWVITMGGRLVRTIWMFKSISKRIITSSTPTKPVLPHFRKLYPTYLENQDQDLKVNLFLLLPHLLHWIHQQSSHFPSKHIPNPSTSLSSQVPPNQATIIFLEDLQWFPNYSLCFHSWPSIIHSPPAYSQSDPLQTNLISPLPF